MASNKESKSTKGSKSIKEANGSKTAHVMNLLSRNRDTAPPPAEQPAA